MIYAFYNTSAGAHYGKEKVEEKISGFFKGEEVTVVDTLTVDDKQSYIDNLSGEDKLVIVGGDGTLNRFVNAIEDKEYPFPIYCCSGGSGNDFVHDVVGHATDDLVQINQYIRHLPIIEVNGETYKFLNGIGHGIDGWACEMGVNHKEKTGNPPNYAGFAVKGLLYAYKPCGAKVTIDGVTTEYENVWMAPTMNGRYFGGGIMITPDQDRLNPERLISAAVVTTRSRFRLLTIFPKIFKGMHVKHKKQVTICPAKEVTVEMDKPIALQIDGEVITGVTKYTARSYALLKEKSTV